jgi:group I intron endonuclease
LEKQKNYGIIYKATNKINGKSYIGQTVKPLNKRINNHISEALNEINDFYFHKAIRKYGEENFIWEIIAECNSLEELNIAEIKLIKKYYTFKNGYNLTKGGEGVLGLCGEASPMYGKKHTKEAKKKMSESSMGEKNWMYGKYGKDCPNFGKIRSEETKKKQSESMKGENHPNYGKHHSEETKKRISKSRKGINIGKEVGSKSPCAKKYIIITPGGGEIFVHGIAEFCKNYKKEKLWHQPLIKVAKGKQKQHKGYKCKYFVE